MSTLNVVAALFLLFGLFSCSATDEAPFGGRVDSPANKDPKAPVASPSTDASFAGIHPGPPYPTGRTDRWPLVPYPMPSSYAGPHPPRLPPSEWWGLNLSPLERVIADTCPDQPWSQYVPEIDCTKDEQCGDGFCDRGRCGAIWTCETRAGLSCQKDEHCIDLLCIEGRCRSCVNDEECNAKYGRKGYGCNLPNRRPHRISICGSPAPRHH